MHPPRSVAGAWDPSYSYYHDPIVVASAARFKQESPEPDGAAAAAASAALLQYSSRLAELPQLESPPLMPHQGSHRRAVADGEGDAVATTDWRALDKFVASQLSPAVECSGSLEAAAAAASTAAASNVGSQLDHVEDDEMAALLFLNSDGREEVERWTGLLGPAGGDGDFGLCVFEK